MGYKLVWFDKFEVDGKPNEDKWTFETGGHGWGNDESQYYTNDIRNAFVKDNILNIVAYKEEYKDNHYTSAKLTTYNKKSIKHGRVKVSAKLPKGFGTWPAIWMLPNSIQENMPWPECGEIDIMEHIGREPEHLHFSLHSKKYNHKINTQLTHVYNKDNMYEDFNDYEVRWGSDFISMYFNGIHIKTFNKIEEDGFEGWPFDQEFYLILNLAIGGGWGGKIDDSIFPVTLQIASVEIYEKE